MDVLPSPSAAAGLLGCSSSHAFVYLAHILQETCMRMEECTNGVAQLAVTLGCSGKRDGVLLYATGYLDGGPPVELSEQIENQMAVGVDIIVSALQDLAQDRQASAGYADRESDLNEENQGMEAEDGAGVDVVDEAADTVVGAGMDVSNVGGAGEGDGRAPALPAVVDGNESGLPRAPPSPAHDTTFGGGHTLRSSAAATMTVSGSPLGRGSISARPSPSPRSSPPPSAASPPVVAGYLLDKSFRVPGLIVPPDRIQLPTGRGASRREPPVVTKEPITIPDAVIEEIIAEVSAVNRGESLRKKLVRFCALYKYVVDTLVERNNVDDWKQGKADHRYPQLTPEALRGVTVTMKWEGKVECLSSPMLANSHDMKVPETLAIIGVMKLQKNSFFLWLLGLFARGALSPPDGKPPAGFSGRNGARKRRRSALPKSAVQESGVSGAGPGRSVGGRAETAAASTEADSRRAERETSRGGRASRAQAVVDVFGARSALHDGKIVATVELHPEWSSFHGAPTPLSVVPCFLRQVADGCDSVAYPFGQNPALCLEKGNPAAQPVPLRSVGTSYKIVWPIESVGYVLCVRSGSVFLLLVRSATDVFCGFAKTPQDC